MALYSLPIELLFILTDFLEPGDHSSLTQLNKYFAAALQPRLLSRLRTLPLEHTKYALIAIYWYSARKDLDQLKCLLEKTTGVTVVNPHDTGMAMYRYNSWNRARYVRQPGIHTSPGVCGYLAWTWIRSHTSRLYLVESSLSVYKYRSAVTHAISVGHYSLLRLAIKQERTRRYAMSAIEYAVHMGSLKSYKIILSTIRQNFGKSTWEATQHKSLITAVSTKGIKFLYDDGETVQSTDISGRTLLHRAITGLMSPPDEPAWIFSHPEVVSALLTEGADVNARDGAGRTALHIAAEGAFPDIITLLLEAGANVDATDDEGCSPIHFALRVENRRKSWEMVALLKGAGADLGIADAKGVTPRALIDRPRECRPSVRKGPRGGPCELRPTRNGRSTE